MDSKSKHLEFIQTTIGRMAGNSFLLKGWTVTVVGGLLAFSFKEMNGLYVGISMAILFFFWLLDSYYLWHERLFRALYDYVRKIPGTESDFSMEIKSFQADHPWHRCAFSPTAALFYGGLLFVQLIILFFLLSNHYVTQNFFQLPLRTRLDESCASPRVQYDFRPGRDWRYRRR